MGNHRSHVGDVGTTCTATGSYGATPNYSCPNGGTLQGTECVTSGSYAATASYSCPNGGTPNGTNCMTTTQTPGTPVYQCSGWALPMDLYTFEKDRKSTRLNSSH